MERIIMIFANGCDECLSMKQAINSMTKFLDLEDKVELYSYNCEEDESLEVALEYGISEVPGCSIG